jgi:hypothetical protein
VALRLSNPYAGCGSGPGAWLRGSIHGHSSEHSGCSSVPLADGIARYRVAGAGFVAVTDHDHVSDLDPARARYPEIVFLEGFEHSSAEHTLFVGERVPPLYRLPLGEALAAADGLLTVISHPRPRAADDYWTVERILALSPRPVGIEIFNGHYRPGHVLWSDTRPLYTETWDALLSRGARLRGYANDDFHDPADFGRAWNMAWVESPSPAGVLGALRSGRCYGTTGLLAESIEVEGADIHVRLTAPAEGRFIGPGGRVLAGGNGTDFAWRHDGSRYIRFEAQVGTKMLWLQPFFTSVT